MPRALILGGARAGTGQATVKAFLEGGFSVAATIDPEVAEETKGAVEQLSDVEWTDLDHGNMEAVADYLRGAAPSDTVVLIENYFYMEDVQHFDRQKWERSIAVNLALPKLVSHAIRDWPSCKSVTVLTSTEAFVGSYGAHAYAATKAAVHNLVKSLANSSSSGVRYNAVAAGWIGGVMDTDEVFNMSREITPLGRLGTPEEVADVIRYVATQATFVNGSVITVDGGYSGVDTISKFEYKTEYPD